MDIIGDSATNREIAPDTNYLKVKNCVITGERVAKYNGSELTSRKLKGQGLVFDPNTNYAIYLPLAEVEKALTTFDGLPLTDDHVPFANSFVLPPERQQIGAIGTEARIEGTDLVNTVVVWADKAQKCIEKADATENSAFQLGKKDLSAGFSFELRAESGNYKGKPYSYVMYDIKGNHVALVKKGRHEPACINDEDLLNKGKIMLRDFFAKFLTSDSSYSNDEAIEMKKAYIKVVKDEDGKYANDADGHIQAIEKARTRLGMACDKEEDSAKAEDEAEMKKEGKAEEGKKKSKEKMSKDKKAKDEDDGEDCAEDSEEDEDRDKAVSGTKKMVKDKKAKDEEAEEKKQANDAMIKETVRDEVATMATVMGYANNILGQTAPNFAQDCAFDADKMADKILSLKNLSGKDKSFETKLGMLEVLRSTKSVAPKYIGDSSPTSASKFKDPFERK